MGAGKAFSTSNSSTAQDGIRMGEPLKQPKSIKFKIQSTVSENQNSENICVAFVTKAKSEKKTSCFQLTGYAIMVFETIRKVYLWLYFVCVFGFFFGVLSAS